ncbi:MAG TPA: hypothetical protein ENJ09_10750 [Planctomycetes bacterium]|nr:hypothetical protein [Planctomycetota bacterium]
MSELEPDWNPDGDVVPKRKRFPKWLLVGCGCGCLTIVVVLIVLGVWIGRVASEGRDPDKQWPKIAKILPFEERPTDLELQLGLSLGFLGFETYILKGDDPGYIATIQYHPNASPESMSMLFDPEGANAPFGLGQPTEGKERMLTIQGREVRALFYRGIGGQEGGEAQGPGVRVDASGESGFTLVDLRMLDPSVQEVPEEVIQDFFEHFEFGDS